MGNEEVHVPPLPPPPPHRKPDWKTGVYTGVIAVESLAIAGLLMITLMAAALGIGSFRAFREEQERSAEFVRALEAYQRLSAGECPDIEECANDFVHHVAQARYLLSAKGRADLLTTRKTVAHIRAERMLAALERRVLDPAHPISALAAQNEIIAARTILAGEGLTIEDIGYSTNRLMFIFGMAARRERESAQQPPAPTTE